MANFGGKSHGQRPNKTILSRTLILMIVCGVVAFSVLGGRLCKLMIADHDYYEQRAVEQQTGLQRSRQTEGLFMMLMETFWR